MDPFMGLIGTEVLPEEKQRAMSNRLRGMAASGAGLATSGLDEISNQGRLMQTQASQQAQGIGLQQARAKADLTDKMLAEGRQASQFAKISGSRADKLYDEVERASTVLSLTNVMPEAGNESGIPLAGTGKNWLATNAPIFSDEEMEINADQWRAWNMEYNNITRHGLFGSALTATEKAAWRAASINENMTPEQIQRNMGIMRGIMQGKAAKRIIALQNEKRDPQWIYDNYSDIMPPEFWENPRGWRDVNRAATDQWLRGVKLEDLSEEDIDRLIAEREG